MKLPVLFGQLHALNGGFITNKVLVPILLTTLLLLGGCAQSEEQAACNALYPAEAYGIFEQEIRQLDIDNCKEYDHWDDNPYGTTYRRGAGVGDEPDER